MQVLLIEDEPKVTSFIQKGLAENGHVVTVAYDGAMGKRMALQHDYDVIVLDIMLPYINGLDLCKQLREEKLTTPILMLTALGTPDDRVEGLQRGADDYLVKPFHFKELVARLHALTRRHYSQPAKKDALTFADITLDREKKTAIRNREEIILTAKEYALLEMFMLNSNRVLSRTFIAEHVWGEEFDPGSNIIDVYINYLRKKIEKEASAKLIHTVIGMGYIMKEN